MPEMPIGSRHVRIALVIVGVVALAALGVRFALPASVVVREGGVGQSCLACRQTGWGDTFSLRASTVTRSYRFTRPATAQLTFDGGTVLFGGTDLAPGCHVLTAREDAVLAFDAARAVRVDVPAPAGDCP